MVGTSPLVCGFFVYGPIETTLPTGVWDQQRRARSEWECDCEFVCDCECECECECEYACEFHMNVRASVSCRVVLRCGVWRCAVWC